MQKRALVTASSKGIGLSVAEKLASQGIEVIISSSNQTHLNEAKSNLSRKNLHHIIPMICDLRNPSSVYHLAGEIKSKYYPIDILVNNCGGPPAGFFEHFNETDWSSAHEEIFLSARSLIEAVLPGMKEKRQGRIVNITSLAVKEYVDNLILSTTYRNALTAFSNVLARQVAEFGVTINQVAPGYTLTGRISELAVVRAKAAGTTPEAILETMKNNVPMKRLAKPEEIASAVSFLCSDDASYITGNTLYVDGGVTKSIQ